MLNKGEWQKIQDVFHVAVKLPESERVSYLDKINLSVSLKEQINRLLDADRKNTAKVDKLKLDISKNITEITTPEIENYDISEKIGLGGMGEVFKARDLKLSRNVAIKILHPHRSQDQKAQQRFLREARASAKINHENICPVFDISNTEDGALYIVSAFCEGESLAVKINNNSMSYERIFSVFEQLLQALGAAHEYGIIHRDLKPDNIIVDKNYRIQLIDFGIAKNFDDLPTLTGEVLGTPDYMPPEQFRGEAFDNRSDIWSCGIILYELLLGFTPYQGKTAPEIIYSMLHESIPIPIENKHALFPFFKIIQDCLQIDKSLRLASIDNLQQRYIKAKQNLDNQIFLNESPSYKKIPKNKNTLVAENLVKQTQRELVVLHLLIIESELNDSLLRQLKPVITKYKGVFNENTDTRAGKIGTNPLMILFGYSLVEDLKVENAKQCGQQIAQLLNNNHIEFKLLAEINTVEENDTSFTNTIVEKNSILECHHLIEQLTSSGLWLTELFAKKIRNIDSLINKSLKIKDKRGNDKTCFFLSNTTDTIQTSNPYAHTHFIGRETQLSFFKENWEQAKEGDQQRILINGEAGIGKSRLIHEFKKEITDFDDIHLVELDCSPYEKASTYFPIMQFLQKQIENYDELNNSLSRENLLDYLNKKITASKTDQLLFLKFMSLDLTAEDEAVLPTGDLLSRKYQDLIMRVLNSKQQNQTSLYIIEDLHWADTATGIIVEKLLQPSSTSQSLIVMSSRPEFKPLWLSNLVTNNLYLNKLRNTQSEKLLKSLIKDYSRQSEKDENTEEFLAKLIERAGGNPLFIEEIAKTFSNVSSNQNNQHIPETLQDTLIARLERIGVAQSLAQLASVIGRDFNTDVLKLSQPISEADFNQQLHTLIQSDIVHSTSTANQYRFKHALIRDAAYQMITPKSQQALHKNLAKTFETHFSETVEAQPELLAQHWERAKDIENSIRYWLIAAERNLKLSATDECISICDHITDLAEKSLTHEKAASLKLNAYMTKGPALMARHGYANESVNQAYHQALNLCVELGDTQSKFPVLFGLWTYDCVKAQHRNAQKIAEEMVSLSEHFSRLEKCEAFMVTGISLFYLGQFENARKSFAKAFEYYDTADAQKHILLFGQDAKVVIQSYQAWNESILGNVEQAISASNEAVGYAKQLQHPFTLTYALSFSSWFNLNLGQSEVAEQLITESIAVCKEYDIAVFLGLSMSLQALVLFSKNEVKKGSETMATAEEIYFSTGALLFIPSFLTAKAEVSMLLEDIETAEKLLDQSIDIMKNSEEEWGMAATFALKSVLHAKKQEMELALSNMQLAKEKLISQKALGFKEMLTQKGIPFDI